MLVPVGRQHPGDRIGSILLRHALDIARESEASALFVVSSRHDRELPVGDTGPCRVILLEAGAADRLTAVPCELALPDVPLTRLGMIRLALLRGLVVGLIGVGDVVVCVAALPDGAPLDTLLVTQISADFAIFAREGGADAAMDPAVLARVLELAIDLATEGREGRVLGALFVVGDIEKVRTLSRPLILNPFHGYRDEERNVLHAALAETVKELAGIDGAFLIRGDGVIEACGVMLQSAGVDAAELPGGLGTRHHAAAAITAAADCVAITVSQSTGNVTVFRRGRVLAELDKLRGRRTASF